MFSWKFYLTLSKVKNEGSRSMSAGSMYHSNIDIVLFEALYGRGYKSSIRWLEVGDVEPLGVDLAREA